MEEYPERSCQFGKEASYCHWFSPSGTTASERVTSLFFGTGATSDSGVDTITEELALPELSEDSLFFGEHPESGTAVPKIERERINDVTDRFQPDLL